MKLRSSSSQIAPGLYQHYKGPKYQVLGTATHSESEETMVVYQTLYGKFDYWVRPLAMFSEEVEVEGKLVPRFRKIAEEE
ncbi:DUF1653 domain-containing protein [Desulfotalea psychrophila]|uniref:DUF1653 domain-containing protein n=1 Tax=Desulfotalea psychrophila (strain LSv54 / DSM 12343) TaxID=177439 RepID=Q6AKZ7_DESPS|nr:DUF1653 domain-containing protein [Desulfotalea psychrophila]CAG36978.1 hypothetical protein DP2249 [Desulfotalea psychrophila LSv54]